MNQLNEILHELGISKVKLAKYLGVSRQMIYNYLELDDINKWPKDKKVLLLNLLGIKSVSEIDNIKVDTDFILDVEARLNNLVQNNSKISNNHFDAFGSLGVKQKELLTDIINLAKEHLEEDNSDSYNTYKYLYHFMQTMNSSKELKYILAYVAKASGFEDPMEFKFNEDEQFVFESILFSGMSLFNGGGASKTKITECHKRFVSQIQHKQEEKLSRTLELNTFKVQALKELGYTSINEQNASEVLEKIAEIQSRKFSD